MESWQWLSPAVIWFITGIVLLVFEIILPGFFLFFFGIGAWIVGIMCLIFDFSIELQLLVFSVSSVILLISLRKYLKRTFIGKIAGEDEKIILDDYAGSRGKVIEDINPPERGKVEVHGVKWNAESNVPIKAGETVEVVNKNNLTLIVKQIS